MKLGVFVGLLGLVLAAFLGLNLHERLDDLLEWIEDNKPVGFLVFVSIYAISAVLFIPGLILSLGAGFVFGLPLGIFAVWTGATVGQTVAFLLGRFLLRDWIASKTQGFKVWQAIEAAAEQEGWKIVGLLRLAPVVPYNFLNYALGLTAVKFWAYFLASTVGILPGTVLYVYIGSLASDIEEISSGDGGVDRTTAIVTAVVSGVAIVLVVILTTYYAKRAIKKKLVVEDMDDDAASVDSSDVECPLQTDSVKSNTGEISPMSNEHTELELAAVASVSVDMDNFERA